MELFATEDNAYMCQEVGRTIFEDLSELQQDSQKDSS